VSSILSKFIILLVFFVFFVFKENRLYDPHVTPRTCYQWSAEPKLIRELMKSSETQINNQKDKANKYKKLL